MALKVTPGPSSGTRAPSTSLHTAELKKHGSIERMWEGQLKLFIAQDNSNGELFIQPLRDIQRILERAVMADSSSGRETRDAPAISEADKHFIYLLVTEKLPQLIAYMPKIKSSKQEMGVLLLDVLCCVMALEQDFLATFPMTFASCLLYCQPSPQWEGACDEIMNRLCHYVLPMCLVHSGVPGSPAHSLGTSSALMMVLESCKATKHHLLITDTLMQLKRDICTDILSVVAYGTPSVRQKALNLLLHYWPLPLPDFPHHPSSAYGEWPTPNCENTHCRRSTTRASVLCLDAQCATAHKKSATKLYMLLCPDCDSTIHGSSLTDGHLRLQFPQPLRDVKPNCEFQKICSGKDRQVNKAEVTCYDSSCTAIQNGQPIRMCRDCHNKQHRDISDPRHIYQVGPPDPWTSDDPASSSTMLGAVSKLLETVPTVRDFHAARAAALRSPAPHDTSGPNYPIEIDTSGEGMWLLAHYCTPATTVRPHQFDWLVHLVALVLEWLYQYFEILQSLHSGEEEGHGGGGGGTVTFSISDLVETEESMYARVFSNYTEISNLIYGYILPWLDAVCVTNMDCVSEALQPNLRGSAQVGSLWKASHTTLECHQHSLSLLLLLCQLLKEHLPAGDTFVNVFNSVMPLWLDLLVQLRAEPGKMEKFQDKFKQIFTSYETHDEGLKVYCFIWEKFRSKDPVSKQRALLWLQDLTRLKVPIPYLPHMFEDALKERRGGKTAHKHTPVGSTSSFDQEVEKRETLTRKESSGSLSGYESESALVSQSSLEQADTQMLVKLNSSLARFILMLDIWLAQLEMKVPTLSYTVFQKTLVHMLTRSWGSLHTYQDHQDTSNMCLLCQAMALWFSLVNKLIKEYARREESDGGDEATDLGSPTVSRRKFSLKQLKSLTPMHRRKKAVSMAEGSVAAVSQHHKLSHGTKISEESVDMYDFDSSRRQSADTVQEFPFEEVRSKNDRPRKMATVQSHSEFEVVSRRGVSSFAPPLLPPAYEGEMQEDAIPPIYKIFRLCMQKLTAKLHPDALQQIVQCISCLLHSGKVLELTEVPTLVSDVNELFLILWQCIECEISFVACSCVGLLFDCVHFLSSNTKQTMESSTLWKILQEGLTSQKWSTKFKTVEKFTMILQFMKNSESLGSEHVSVHPAIQATLAHGFCQLVLALQDQNSNICTRTRYCISSLKESVIEALKHFLVRLFSDHAPYRTLVLETLSLLGSALPEFHFVSVDLLTNLLACVTTPTRLKEDTQLLPRTRVEAHPGVTKKASDANVLSGAGGGIPRGATPKVSTASVATILSGPPEDSETTGLVQEIVSLLLRYVGNLRSDCKDSVKKLEKHRNQKRRTLMGRSTAPASSEAPEETLVELLKLHVCRNFHCIPSSIRRSGIFEIFLNHIFSVLDHNPEFGLTKGLLPFVLRLLGYSAAPTLSDFPHMVVDDKQLRWTQCSYTIGSLPPNLQVPWLKVFFVILYKYSHHFSESEPNDHEVLVLIQWCLEIALNSLETDPHICTLLTRPEPRHERPVLRKQSSFTSDSSQTLTRDQAPLESPVRLAASSLMQQREGAALTPVPEEMELLGEHKSAPGSFQKQPVRATDSGSTISSFTSVTDSLRSSATHVNPPLGVCFVCGKATNEYTEEVIAHCVVAVGTCSNRMPHTVSSYLVSRIIPAIAKVIVPGSYPWQMAGDSEPPPGSAMAVSMHFLASILTQFADRRLFLYLFGHNLGTKAEAIFTAMAESLVNPEGEGDAGEKEDRKLSQSSPIKYLFQDALSSSHFAQEVRRYSLINLASYVDVLDSLMPTTALLMREIPLWDAFCKKLKSHTELLRDTKAVHCFLRVIIMLLNATVKNPLQQYSISAYHAHTVQSFMQSLSAVVEAALHNVYCPLGGLVQLAGLWYKVFQQHSHRESEKFVKLYIVELRKAFKACSTGGSIRADNFLSLIQVLLLEEDGYLGYVDGLTERRLYAPDLKHMYETHCLSVIDGIQWDFVDTLYFLSNPNHRRHHAVEMIPQLKLSLAQLVALRMQHGRPPVGWLRRIIQGDIRALTTPNPKSGGGGTAVCPHWQASLIALHMLTWLMLGAMCHNTIDTAALEMKMEGNVSGLCQLLGSLNTRMNVTTQGVINLATGVLERLAVSNEPNIGFLYQTFMFAAIWTVYMELYVQESAVFIVEFWQKFISQLIQQLTSTNTDENYRKDIVYSLNELVVVRVKRVGLSSYSLLLPIWREVTNLVADPTLVFPDLPSPAVVVPVDIWFREAVKELVTIEGERQPTDNTATTAL